MKNLLLLLLWLIPVALCAQVIIPFANSTTTITFDGPLGGVSTGSFAGTGFGPVGQIPSGGLNSGAVRISGFSDGTLNFGGTATGTVGSHMLYRGTVSAPVADGSPGVYAYNGAVNNNILGGTASGVLALLQPNSSEFNAGGELVIRAVNNTGQVLTGLNISADLCVRNDSDNSSSYSLAYSATTDTPGAYAGNQVFTYTTPGPKDFLPPIPGLVTNVICLNTGLQSATGLNIPDGGFFYLKLTGTDAAGATGNDRDEVFIDNISFSGIQILPVEFLSFTAEKAEQGIALDWRTATEENNAGFYLEHSTNGKQFATISKIEGAGTTLEEQHYRFVDENPFPGTNYYRLRQVDFDGTEDFSAVVSQNWQQPSKLIPVFPNPTAGVVTVAFGEPLPLGAFLTLVNTQGQTMETFTNLDQNEMSIDLTNYPAGAYYLRVIERNQVRVQTIFKR